MRRLTNTGKARIAAISPDGRYVVHDDGSFDSGNLDVGKTYSTIANLAGTIAYHCTIHPQMKATIVVAP